MIRRRAGFYQLFTDVVPRLELAHADLTRLVGLLRDPAVAVLTILPTPVPQDGVARYSVVGWRQHFAAELARFTQFRASAETLTARQRFAEVDTALADYVEALPRVVAALDLLLARYPDAATVSQSISATHRRALADAIATELAV